MIRFKTIEGCEPSYKTSGSAGADLRAREGLLIKAGSQVKIPCGVWIEAVDWNQVPKGFVPEIQIRARSGLAFKHGITLTNAVGTIDCDYPEEICVLLWNTSSTDFSLQKGDRIAQLIISLVFRLPLLVEEETRTSGFGSTGLK